MRLQVREIEFIGRGFVRSRSGEIQAVRQRRNRIERRARCRTAVKRVDRVDRQTQRCGLVPLLALPTRHLVHVLCQRTERLDIIARCVNLHQLETNRLPGRLSEQCFPKDVLRLRLTTVGDIDIRLGNRVDFSGLRFGLCCRDRGEATVVCIDALAACRAEQGIGCKGVSSDQTVFELLDLAATTHCVHRIAQAECGHTTDSGQQQRVVEQVVEQAGLRNRCGR